MSGKFISKPKFIQLNLEGKDGIIYPYEWEFDTSNNTWGNNPVGMYRDSQYGYVRYGDTNYIEPLINYSIQDGIIEGNINECDRGDFPMYNFDLDCFFVGRFVNRSTDAASPLINYSRKRCDYTVIPNDDANYSHYYVSLRDIGGDSKTWAGEFNNQSFQTAEGYVLNGISDGTKITITTPTKKYSRPYKIYPEFPLRFNNDMFCSESLYKPSARMDLAFNIYINWNKYIDQLKEIFTNSSSLYTKYGVKNISTLEFGGKEESNYLAKLLGFYNYNTISINPLNFIILYNAEIKIGDTVFHKTNLNPAYAPLNNWVHTEDGSESDNYVYVEGDEKLRTNFNKVIDLYTSSIDTGATYVNSYYEVGRNLYEYTTNLSTATLNLYNDDLLEYNTWEYILTLNDLSTRINSVYGSTPPITGILANIDVKFLVIQIQQNNSGNNDYSGWRFNYKVINKSIVVKSKTIDYNNDILDRNGNLAFVDYPVMRSIPHTGQDYTYEYASSSGVFGTFNGDSADKFNAGYLYSLTYNSNTNTYYNYTLNKQAVCNGSGPLNWTDIPS